jgi:hypothetical protein
LLFICEISGLAVWAEAYGDQTEKDHAKLVQVIAKGKIKATQGL